MTSFMPAIFAAPGSCVGGGSASARQVQAPGTTNVPAVVVWGTDVVRQMSLQWMGQENWTQDPVLYQLGAHMTVTKHPVTFHALRVNKHVVWAENIPTLSSSTFPGLEPGTPVAPTGAITSFTRVRVDHPAHGLRGAIEFYTGEPGQSPSSRLQAAYGTTAAALVQMTGQSMLFFDEFCWGETTEGLPLIDLQVSALVSRFPTELDPTTAIIPRTSNIVMQTNRTTGADYDSVVTVEIPYPGDANPAHVLYDILTNRDWGFGVDFGKIDAPTFQAAASTLANEQFGISLAWSGFTKLESIVQDILEHIHAVLDVDPATDKWRLRLLRGDYDFTDPNIPTIDPYNASFDLVEFAACDTPPNEVAITWVNPENMNDETTLVQDPSIPLSYEDYQSVQKDYWMVRDRYLAFQLGLRDLRLGRARRIMVQCRTDYSMWDLRPGDVVRLVIPELEINGIPCRVTSIIHEPTKGVGITVGLSEDIFGLSVPPAPVLPLETPQSTLTNPTPLDKNVILSAPYVWRPDGIPEDREVLMVLATDAANDCLGFLAVRNGGAGWQDNGELRLTDTAQLGQALVAESETTIPVDQLTIGHRGGHGPVLGQPVILGDADQEWAFISGFNTTNQTVTLRRGVFDTLPRAWPVGTPVWFLDRTRSRNMLSEARPPGNEIYRFRTKTAVGVLDLASAPDVAHTVETRGQLPLRPANTSVGGTAWPAAAVVNGVTAVTVQWANRNRLTEDPTAPKAWSDTTSDHEPGQETLVEVLDGAGTVIHSVVAPEGGTSVSLPVAVFGALPFTGKIRLTAQRSGLFSLQSVLQDITVNP